jgi:hypothetical protein
MIQQTDVDTVLERGREFYKFGFKTTNKFYLYPVLEKHLRRARSTTAESMATLDQQRALFTGSRRDYGQQLHENNLTLGNCGEMTAVIAWLIRTTSELASKVTMSMVAYTPGNDANHYFNIVTDQTASWPPQFARIDQIEAVAPSTGGIWVIDLWSKIACPVADYPRLVREKADAWTLQNKMISYPGGQSSARQFIDFIAMQPLLYEYV